MKATSSSEPIVNYQEEQNTTSKDHEVINLIQQKNNIILICNKSKELVFVEKQEKTKPKASNNQKKDKFVTHLDKPKLEIQRKD